MPGSKRSQVLRRIVERTDLDAFADRVLDSFWDSPEYKQLRPPRDDVRAWVRWNLDLVIRWLTEGRPPTEGELEVFRERARARAADGMPADVVPANFRRGARFAWRALMEAAADEERPALVDSAELLFEYVDEVSRVFSEVYEAVRSAPTTVEETAARALLRRIAADEPPLPEDQELAERIGFPLEHASRPFVIASPRRPAEYFAELAALLRRRRALAASEGRRTVGLAGSDAPWRGMELDRRAVIAHGPLVLRLERGQALDELRAVVDVAVARAHYGEMEVDDYLPELLLRRSPRIAARIAERVYGPLGEELAHTLDLLVAHSFERGPTAAALPVHRNTLRDRVNRICELTGLDLDTAQGRGVAWLAWLHHRDSSSRPAVRVRG